MSIEMSDIPREPAEDPKEKLARIEAAFNTEDDTNDLAVKDYDLLERRYKHNGWCIHNQSDFELGWEAAVQHLRKLLRG